MRISDILSGKGRDVHCVSTGRRLGDVAGELAERRIGATPVLGHDGAILGIFSERDLVKAIAEGGADALDWPVDQAMSAPALTVTADTPILAALAQMTQRRFRHLPVVEEGEIRGIVSIGDLVKHRIERIEAEASALRDYITQG